MTRCDYDSVFYRVFAVTLLALALTFTVILTNVFIDIDGLITKKDNGKTKNCAKHDLNSQEIDSNGLLLYTSEYNTKNPGSTFEKVLFLNPENTNNDIKLVTNPNDNNFNKKEEQSIKNFNNNEDLNDIRVRSAKQEPIKNDKEGGEDKDFLEDNLDITYDITDRNKRSLDTMRDQRINPKMKAVFIRRLSKLLEELDEEETDKKKQKDEDIIKAMERTNKIDEIAQKEIQEKTNDVVHLAMHNIMLQGIIKHMDFNEVYRRMQKLMESFKSDNKPEVEKKDPLKLEKVDKFFVHLLTSEAQKNLVTETATDNQLQNEEKLEKDMATLEGKFVDELTKCNGLQKEIKETKPIQPGTRRSGSNLEDPPIQKSEKHSPYMLIKTVIDIKSPKTDKRKDNKTDENIKGMIRLIFNGKPIKFTKYEDEGINEEQTALTPEQEEDKKKQTQKQIALEENTSNILDKYVGRALDSYLKKNPELENKVNNREKRNVKYRKKAGKGKKNGSDLYVEIEAQVDGKSLKGAKKKKLIQRLVEKIQQAVNSDLKSLKEIKKTKITVNPKKFKQRHQKSLKTLKHKKIAPTNTMLIRELDPIGNAENVNEHLNSIYDKLEDSWKKESQGANFISNANAINSRETTGELDLDYNKIEDDNSVPQRVQQPLNYDDLQQELDDVADYFDIGDLKFYVKDIDGTGFSIGFNQYVGEAPDKESIQLFTGIQKLIKTYHQNYDLDNTTQRNETGERKKRQIKMMDTFTQEDLFSPTATHYNQYEVIFDKHYLPYDSYSEIFEDRNKKVSVNLQKDEDDGKQKDKILNMLPKKEVLPLVIDDNLFKKRLKPSEILGIANLLDREKRSPTMKLRQISNVNTRTKLNRFLNTNKKNKRIVMRKHPRSKRQIENIRILASDLMPQKRSDENVYVVSDENVFPDRPSIREEVVEESEGDPVEESEYLQPYEHQEYSQVNQFNIFGARARHNALMSKYPHVFLEDIVHSKEEGSDTFYNKLIGNYPDLNKYEVSTPSFLATPLADPRQPIGPLETNEINHGPSISPGEEHSSAGSHRPNYRLTFKVIPKLNSTDGAGFKEIHTSINRSISRHGVVYSSQVNITELSRVEHLNVTEEPGLRTTSPSPYLRMGSRNLFEVTSMPDQPTVLSPYVSHIKEQQEKMKMLLKAHKKKIDEQLESLKREKQNIDTIMPQEKKSDFVDVVLPMNPPKYFQLNKAEAGELIASALMKLHGSPQLNDIVQQNSSSFSKITQVITKKNPTTAPETTTFSTMTSTTPLPTTKKQVDYEKIKILETIQRNENLTNVILYKIDKNTNLLQHFLSKLSDKLDLHVNAPKTDETKLDKVVETRKQWSSAYMHAPFLHHTIPNTEIIRKNDTHVTIPFVYAYQQPYPISNKPNTPNIASVVYQGHIHTNANPYNTNFQPYLNNFKKSDDRNKLAPELTQREVTTRYDANFNRTRHYLSDKYKTNGQLRTFDLKNPNQNMIKAYDIMRIKKKSVS